MWFCRVPKAGVFCHHLNDNISCWITISISSKFLHCRSQLWLIFFRLRCCFYFYYLFGFICCILPPILCSFFFFSFLKIYIYFSFNIAYIISHIWFSFPVCNFFVSFFTSIFPLFVKLFTLFLCYLLYFSRTFFFSFFCSRSILLFVLFL